MVSYFRCALLRPEITVGNHVRQSLFSVPSKNARHSSALSLQFAFHLIIMVRLSLHFTSFKIFRLLLPLAVVISGTTIFLCGMVRTYHIAETQAKNLQEERYMKAKVEYMEWWVGFVLVATGILAMVAVLVDKPLLFKMSVGAIGVCFVLTLYALFWDAGEFSYIAQDKSVMEFLKADGHECQTTIHNFTYTGVRYLFRDCECSKGSITSIDFFVPYSCEILNSLYYVHAVLAFAMACAIAFCLFTIFSFVLILKRISQITTALHLDEKPLSEDFGNVSGNLYLDQS